MDNYLIKIYEEFMKKYMGGVSDIDFVIKMENEFQQDD